MTNAFEDLSEIHRNLRLQENKLVGVLFTPGFVATRDIVVEWISDVCKECSLTRTTTAQAIALFDAILTNDDLMLKAPRSLYQQFACAAILIAAKIEEIEEHVPSVGLLNYYTKSSYNEEQILHSERLIINHLDWNVRFVTAYSFYSLYISMIVLPNEKSIDPAFAQLSQQRLKESCVERADNIYDITSKHYQFLSYLPSVLAGSIVFLARQLMKIYPFWPIHLQNFSLLTPSDLEECILEFIELLES
jgi:hypothetical protein